jgi:UDP-N-acetylglucosamine--N-acetylmuramyl-(pentapeptide) pyrophosphoryl-undecaprenol N-acetylglucosamine transferase
MNRVLYQDEPQPSAQQRAADEGESSSCLPAPAPTDTLTDKTTSTEHPVPKHPVLETVLDLPNQSHSTHTLNTEPTDALTTDASTTDASTTDALTTDALTTDALTEAQPTRATVVLATGGTGGHIYPAIAVAQALQAAGYEVLVIGQKRGLEAQLVPAAGLRFVGVSAGKLDRQRPNPLAVVKVVWGVLEALWQVAKAQPVWVIGFGGFASFPALAAGWCLRRPLALHEANAYPGLVTKVMARAARVVAVADPAVQSRLPKRVAVVPVGLPIRTERVSQADARYQLGLPQDALVTLVMGGSQGAKILNDYVPEAYNQLVKEREHVVLHSAGRGREAEVSRVSQLGVSQFSDAHNGHDAHKAHHKAHKDTYRVVPYVDAAVAWSAADVAITRAGSSTLAEAAFYGVPLIMVPFAAAAEQHQLHNARAVAASGAGVVVEEHQLRQSVAPLVSAWQRLCDVEFRQQAQHAAGQRAYPQAAACFLAALGLTGQQ